MDNEVVGRITSTGRNGCRPAVHPGVRFRSGRDAPSLRPCRVDVRPPAQATRALGVELRKRVGQPTRTANAYMPHGLASGAFLRMISSRNSVDYAGRIRQGSARAEAAADRNRAPHRAASEGRGRFPHHAGKPDCPWLHALPSYSSVRKQNKSGNFLCLCFQTCGSREKS
jgi:hypothetical protein